MALSGLLNLLKPPAMTSHDAVQQVRRALHQVKVGHAGTLDPGAGGVLVVAIGEATRVVEWLQGHDKVYRAELRLGLETDTYDLQGTTLAETDASWVTREQVEAALAGFRGDLQQVPPAVSAKHYGGRRWHQLARAGVPVPRRPVAVRIFSLHLREFQPGPRARVRLEIHCSTGTYVRALAHDLGRRLGCGATLAFLLRLRCGPFLLADAHTLEEWGASAQRGEAASLLQPMQAGLTHLPRVWVEPEAVSRLSHGQGLRLQEARAESILPEGPLRLETPDGLLVAIARREGDVLRPQRVLVKPQEVG